MYSIYCVKINDCLPVGWHTGGGEGKTDRNTEGSGSSSSTGSGSPPTLGRPSSFQGIRHKPKVQAQPLKTANYSTPPHLHKPMHTIQPSPLARTPSPSPLALSPIRSPSPMTNIASAVLHPGISNMAQMYSPARPEKVLARRSLDQPLNYSPADSRAAAIASAASRTERAPSPDHLHPRTAERLPPRKSSMQ
jgi:hypothetical protein